MSTSIDAGHRLLESVLTAGETRLRLFATEWHAEGLHVARLAVLLALAIFALCLAIVATGAFVVVLFWDTHRLAALGGVTLGLLALAGALAWRALALARARPRLFAASLAALAADREALRG